MKHVEAQQLDFWHRELAARGFFRDVTYGSSETTWFRNGDFHIGYLAEDFRDKFFPFFEIIYHGLDGEITVDSRLEIEGFSLSGNFASRPGTGKGTSLHRKVEEFLEVLDALTIPKHAPLAIGIKWAEELVYAVLQRSAAGRALTTTGDRT